MRECGPDPSHSRVTVSKSGHSWSARVGVGAALSPSPGAAVALDQEGKVGASASGRDMLWMAHCRMPSKECCRDGRARALGTRGLGLARGADLLPTDEAAPKSHLFLPEILAACLPAERPGSRSDRSPRGPGPGAHPMLGKVVASKSHFGGPGAGSAATPPTGSRPWDLWAG